MHWYWLLLTQASCSCWLYDRISAHLTLTVQSYILGPLMLQSIQRIRSPWHRAAHSFLFHFLHTRSKPSSIKRFLWKCLSQSTPSWCSHPHSKSALIKHELQNKWLLNEWNRSDHSIIGISRYLLSVGLILLQSQYIFNIQYSSHASVVSVHPKHDFISSQNYLKFFLFTKSVYSVFNTNMAVENRI